MISFLLVFTKELTFDVLVKFEANFLGAHDAEEIAETVEDFCFEPDVGPFAAEQDAGMGKDIDDGLPDGGGGPLEPLFEHAAFGSSREMMIFVPEQGAFGVAVGGDDEWSELLWDVLDEPPVQVARVNVNFGAKTDGDPGFEFLELLLQHVEGT